MNSKCGVQSKRRYVYVGFSIGGGCVLLLTTLADEVYQSEWGFMFICLLNFGREMKRTGVEGAVVTHKNHPCKI